MTVLAALQTISRAEANEKQRELAAMSRYECPHNVSYHLGCLAQTRTASPSTDTRHVPRCVQDARLPPRAKVPTTLFFHFSFFIFYLFRYNYTTKWTVVCNSFSYSHAQRLRRLSCWPVGLFLLLTLCFLVLVGRSKSTNQSTILIHHVPASPSSYPDTDALFPIHFGGNSFGVERC